jgi:hypothetical protein
MHVIIYVIDMGVTVIVPRSRISILVRIRMHHCPVWITLQKAAKNSELKVKTDNDKEKRNLAKAASYSPKSNYIGVANTQGYRHKSLAGKVSVRWNRLAVV